MEGKVKNHGVSLGKVPVESRKLGWGRASRAYRVSP